MIQLLFFAAVLVPGIGESVPSTDEVVFKVMVEPDIVEDFRFEPRMGVISFTIDQGSDDQSLLVRIPKNFPILATLSPSDPSMIALGDDDTELYSSMAEDGCFYSYAVSLRNSTSVRLFYTYELVGEPRYVSNTIDKGCFEEVFVEPECGDGRELQYNQRLEQVCVFPSSAERLLAKGYLI